MIQTNRAFTFNRQYMQQLNTFNELWVIYYIGEI